VQIRSLSFGENIILNQSFLETLSLIKSDMQFRCDYEHKKLTSLRIIAFLLNHAAMSIVFYRFQVFFYRNHLPWLAKIIQGLSSIIFTVNIDSRTQIGPGILLLHASYVNIGKNVTIGKNCILAHQNTIGPSFVVEADGSASEIGPVIGDHVLLGVGSAVFGNITIGSGTKVGVNSAVDKSFPDNAVLVGVPARNRAIL
jgi:serine O-acetyltransferase